MYSSLLDQAFSLFTESELLESQRLFHGRGRCYKGLEQVSIDWFSPVLFIVLYKPLAEFSIERFSGDVETAFKNRFPNTRVEAVLFQDRSGERPSTRVLRGQRLEAIYAFEAGNSFVLDLFQHQNVGFFLDARHARQKVRQLADGKQVLNLFAYTCSFSVVALSGGAQSVVNLDMGRGVLERGKENHDVNGLDSRKASFIKSDIFKAWKKLHKLGRYKLLIIDPPSFQKGSFSVERDYPKLIRQLPKLLSAEADIVACLNSPFLPETFLDECFLEGPLNKGTMRLEKQERLSNPKAFRDVDPDAGLKVVHYRYWRSDLP